MATLKDVLAARTREGELYHRLDNDWVHCYACGHNCPIPEGALGVCKVRFNEGGRLLVPWGYVGGVQCDPIEKKPFFHVHPGALAYSFGMLGCDLHCGYCQNWVTSQALRDPQAVAPPLDVTPERSCATRVERGAKIIVSTYNEPLITSEWAVAIFKEARAAGLMTGFVSNGNGTPGVLEYLRPWIDVYKVDLKSFDDRHYRELGGRLQPILDTIRRLHGMGVWVEIVTLLIPGFNDSDDELKRLTEFVAERLARHPVARHGVSRRLQDDRARRTRRRRCCCARPRSARRPACATCTPAICRARSATSRTRTARSAASCSIERYGYLIRGYHLTPAGACPACGTQIPGRWSDVIYRTAHGVSDTASPASEV